MVDTFAVKDHFLYDIADTLGFEIHDMGDKFRGFSNASITIGPWSFDTDISLISDATHEHEVSFFIKVVGALWLYLVKDVESGLRLYVIDGSILKLHVKDIFSYGTGSVSDTVKKMKKGLITQYRFDEFPKKWVEYDEIGHTDNSGPTTNVLKALPPPKKV